MIVGVVNEEDETAGRIGEGLVSKVFLFLIIYFNNSANIHQHAGLINLSV